MENTKKWVLKKQSWRGPAAKAWRIRDDADTDLKAVWSDKGRLTQITLPLRGQDGVPADLQVDLAFNGATGFYRGAIREHQVLTLLEVNESSRTMRGIFYSFKDGPVTMDKLLGVTDPEPIGIWGAEEREGNEWPLKP